MYVVLRQADVGDVDTLAAFENELDAEELADLANWRDGDAYRSRVEYTPLSDSPRQSFIDIFNEDPPEHDQ